MNAALKIFFTTSLLFFNVKASDSRSFTTAEGYSVKVFECDRNLAPLSTADRQKKISGSVYRLCMQPSQEALDNGISIESVDVFNWELEHKQGVAEQAAVINGDGDNVLTTLTCDKNGKLCYIDSILSTQFYVDSGSVLGYGQVTLSGGKGTVDVERYLFPHDFKFTMVNADGSEMSEEELAELQEKMEKQGVQYVGSASSSESEPVEAAEL